MLELKGPWLVGRLRTRPICPWQDDCLGTYIVAVVESKYRVEHGPSRFIYIGAMGTTRNISLRMRTGDFLADAFGFLHHHSGGTRFYEELTLSPWDLEFWWYETNDPLCCEAMLMKVFTRTFGRLPRLNKQQNRKGCGHHLNELNNGAYEKATRYPWGRK